jgi:deoxyadenosine/deoxycytidine kinase
MNIAISGSTCAGKTTLISLLCEHPFFKSRCAVISERAAENPYLGVPGKVFLSQIFFYASYFSDINDLFGEGKPEHVFFDRSVDEHMLISRFRYGRGELTASELNLCNSFASLIKENHPQIDKTVYLYCSAETVSARQKKRGDSFTYSKDFIEELNLYYTEFAQGQDNILFVNTDDGIDIERIVDFLKK